MKQKNRPVLEHDDILAALEAAKSAAAGKQLSVSIAIVDDGGHPLGFLRMSDATPMSATISLGKARTAALARRESKFYEEMIRNGRNAYLSVPDLVFLEGGVPALIGADCVGGVGVSGALPAQDAEVALAAINALAARVSPVS